MELFIVEIDVLVVDNAFAVEKNVDPHEPISVIADILSDH